MRHNFSLSYLGTKSEQAAEESLMLVLDAPSLLGIAAVLTSLSALIWSLRRKP